MFQAKYPAHFSIPVFKSIQKSCIGFSKYFKTTQHRKYFVLLILSIINQGSTRLKEAGQIINKPISVVENLSRFLKKSPWNICLLRTMHYSFLKNKIPSHMYVATDFSAIVKTGKKFEYIGQVHDGRDNKIKTGYNLLMTLGINQLNCKEQFILHNTVCSNKDPNWDGENKVITQHIEELFLLYNSLKINLKEIIHVADRGFDRKYIVEKFLKEEGLFVIRAKDKSIKLKDGTCTKLYNLKPGIYHNVYIKAWKIFLNVVIVKGREKKDDQKEEMMVLLTNILVRNLTRKKIKEIYHERWNIEVCFKKLKSNYGLEEFRIRSWNAIQKLISLTLFAYNLSQYYLMEWIKRVSADIHINRYLKSVYLLRKHIQKLLNFGFQPVSMLDLNINRLDSG